LKLKTKSGLTKEDYSIQPSGIHKESHIWGILKGDFIIDQWICISGSIV